MAQRVASLYAEIGADTSGLDKGLARARSGLRDTADGAKNTGTRFTEMASKFDAAKSALNMTTRAAGQVWDIFERGAAMELAKGRFDNLTASIGTTSSALTGELTAATGGMMSNAEQIASATQIISLGLADTQEEVVDLASLTSQLGWDMQQVIMTFANDSVMRLDALGLSVEDVTKRQKELEEQGYATSEAFDLAVIDAGKAKLELLGSAADTGAGGMARLEVKLVNVKDALLGIIGTRTEGVWAGLANTIDAVSGANDDLRRAYDLGYISQAQYVKGLIDVNTIASDGHTVLRESRDALEEYDNASTNASYALAGFTQSQDSARMSLNDTTDALVDWSTESTYATEAQQRGRQSTIDYIVSKQEEEAATLAAAEATRQATKAASIQSEAYHLMSSAIGAAADPIRDYFQAQTDIVASQGEWVGAFTDTSAEISEVNAALSADLSDEQKRAWAEILTASEEGGAEWTAAYNALQGDLTQSQRNGLIARQNELQSANGQAISVYTGDAAAYEAAQQAKIEANNAVIMSLKEVALATIEGQVTAAVASGELSAAAGNAFLAGVGEGLGLLSEAEADAQLAVGNASLEMAEKLDQSLAYVIETGGATAREIGVMSGETTAAIAENWEDLQDESRNALAETGKIKDMIIDGIPDEKIVTIKIRTEGSVPDLGGGATGGEGGGAGTPGGYGEYATGGVVPGPMGMPQLAVVHGGEEVLTPAQRNTRGGGGGNVNISFSGAIFQGTTQQQAASMVSMVAEELGRL